MHVHAHTWIVAVANKISVQKRFNWSLWLYIVMEILMVIECVASYVHMYVCIALHAFKCLHNLQGFVTKSASINVQQWT